MVKIVKKGYWGDKGFQDGYVCEGCKTIYRTPEEAETCESYPMKPLKFKRGDIVVYESMMEKGEIAQYKVVHRWTLGAVDAISGKELPSELRHENIYELRMLEKSGKKTNMYTNASEADLLEYERNRSLAISQN